MRATGQLCIALTIAACRLSFEPQAVRSDGADGDALASNDALLDDAATDGAMQMRAAVVYLKAFNTDAGDNLGNRVAVSADGAYVVAAAKDEDGSGNGVDPADDDLALDAGAVYVYARSGASYVQQAYLKASNSEANDQFGFSVAISHDGATIAVGATLEDGASTGTAGNPASNASADSGAVYIFTRSGTTWTQQAYIKASNTEAGDEFGHAVALSGDGSTLAVGARAEDSNATTINGSETDNSRFDAGAVYVFTRSGSTWSQQAYVKPTNTTNGDVFGFAVALATDGNTLAVGAPLRDVGVSNSGAAYIFTRMGTTWSQQQMLQTSVPGNNDELALRIALSGDGSTFAAGAIFEDGNGSGVGGDETNNGATDSGAAYVFSRITTTWSQQAYIKSATGGATSGDVTGWSSGLSSDGNVLVVGSPREDGATESVTDGGATYVLTRSGTTWSHSKLVRAPNPSNGDELGQAVAISADSTTIVVGSVGEDSAATAIDGNGADNTAGDAGAVYVFDRAQL